MDKLITWAERFELARTNRKRFSKADLTAANSFRTCQIGERRKFTEFSDDEWMVLKDTSQLMSRTEDCLGFTFWYCIGLNLQTQQSEASEALIAETFDAACCAREAIEAYYEETRRDER